MLLSSDIHVVQSRIWQLNSIIWLTQAPCVVDPAYFPDEIESLKGLFKYKEAPTMVFTHGDFDHVVGASYFPQSKIVAQQKYAATDIEAQIKQLNQTDQSYDIARGKFNYPQPDILFASEMELNIGKRSLLLFHTPGHTADSIVIVDANSSLVAVGDMLSDIEFPFIYFNSDDYVNSLRKVKSLIDEFSLIYLVPGHGSPAKSKDEILVRIQTDLDYLAELKGRVSDLYGAGMSPREIKMVMAEMRYKGDYVGGLLHPHLDNVDKVLQEIWG